MKEWEIIVIAISSIIGLISLIYHFQTKRISILEEDLKARPKAEDVLSIAKHESICKEAKKGMEEFIVEQNKDLKEYFNVRIENVILKELRDIIRLRK